MEAEMNSKAVFAASMVFVFGHVGTAAATMIDLNLGVAFAGPTYTQDGYTFTASNPTTGWDPGEAFGNWLLIAQQLNVPGLAGLNANGTNPTLVVQYPSLTTTITNDANTPFSFLSISLADADNTTDGGNIQFSFQHQDNTVDTIIVSLAEVQGLQTFTFDETNLQNVSVKALTTDGGYLQFDFVDVSAVPEPSTWAMMLLGFVGLGFLAHRKRAATRLDGIWSATQTPAVPEPSTWAMMILGFLGLGFLAHRRRDRLFVA
jgi:hypothetical protein